MSIIESADDQTDLQGQIVEQAQLYRMLNWLFDYGVDLIGLYRAEEAT